MPATRERNKTKRFSRSAQARRDTGEPPPVPVKPGPQRCTSQKQANRNLKQQDNECRALMIHENRKLADSHCFDKVSHQLIHLLLAYNGQAPAEQSTEPYKLVRKLRTIMSLYWKLLKADTLYLSAKSNPEIPLKNFDILNSRLEVLRHIENLEGYCDAINQLRLIIKSSSMIGVMIVYDKISRMASDRVAEEEAKCNTSIPRFTDLPV